MRLSNILRYVLYETGEGKVPLEKEVQYLKDYIELETIRVGKRVDIRFQTQGDLGNKVIEPMLFLTFVENSFKHGAANAVENGWVDIQLDSGETDITFSIANSKSLSPNSHGINDSQGGIGLQNLQKRLDILYPLKYMLELLDSEDSYKVNLILKN